MKYLIHQVIVRRITFLIEADNDAQAFEKMDEGDTLDEARTSDEELERCEWFSNLESATNIAEARDEIETRKLDMAGCSYV